MIEQEFIQAMLNAGFSIENTRKALHCFDSIIVNYNISKKDANIVKYNSANANTKLLELFFQCKKFEGMADKTISTIKTILKQYVEYLPCSILDAQPMHIRLFLSQWQQQKKIKNSSLNKYKQFISSLYSWLQLERQITVNPCLAIPKIKTICKFQGALSMEDLNRIKYACIDDKEKLLIEFLVSTGVRINEFVNIKLGDIDMLNRSLTVLGKGNKERIVYFSTEAKVLIEKIYGDISLNKNNYLFTRDYVMQGNKVCTNYARAKLKNIIDRIYLKSVNKVTPHTFRRTFATLMLGRGVPLEKVSKLLGHASLNTTLRYANITQNELKMVHDKYAA